MADIGFWLGALIATRLMSGLFLWLTKSWDGGIQRLAVVHLVSLVAASLLGGMTLSTEGNFTGVNALGLYFIPQIIWLAFDIYCFRQQKTKLQKVVVVTSSVIALLVIVSIFLLEALGTSRSDIFTSVSGELAEPNTQNSNVNGKVATIMLKSVNIPYALDSKTTLTEITATENSAFLIFETSQSQFSLFEVEKIYWNEYFCGNSEFFQLLTEGATISFLYLTIKDSELLDSYSITAENCG